MDFTFKPNARACSTRDQDVEDLLCSDNMGEGLATPLLPCPQTPGSGRSRSPSADYSETPRYGRPRSPIVEYPPSPSSARRSVNQDQGQHDNADSPVRYLNQLKEDMLIMQSQMETLMLSLQEKDADNSRLREQVHNTVGHLTLHPKHYLWQS